MIVADLSMIPMGSGTSASRYVQAVYEILAESGANFLPGPMSTALETETLEDLFRIVEKANGRLAEMGVQRIITNLRIDLRLDKEISLESQLSHRQEDMKVQSP
jgi:uncharacterized protein (TIGR00106 family)